MWEKKSNNNKLFKCKLNQMVRAKKIGIFLIPGFISLPPTYMDKRVTKCKKNPPKLALHKCMEDKTPTCSPKSLCSLTSNLLSEKKNYQRQKTTSKRVWCCNSKNPQNKHHYTILYILSLVLVTVPR